MKTKEEKKTALETANEYAGPCTCHEIYTSRGKRPDPACFRCMYAKDIADLLESYARPTIEGKEEIIQECYVEIWENATLTSYHHAEVEIKKSIHKAMESYAYQREEILPSDEWLAENLPYQNTDALNDACVAGANLVVGYVKKKLSSPSKEQPSGTGSDDCPECKGTGEIEKNIQREGYPEMDVPIVCADCNGTGKVPQIQFDFWNNNPDRFTNY